MIHFLARPHVVSWLFRWRGFGCWSRREKECYSGTQSRRLLVAAAVTMLVWVNVHGGFLVGFVAFGNLLDQRGMAVVESGFYSDGIWV